MAIHKWDSWSKKTEDDISRTLHEYKRCGLNAVEILSEGPGYSQNPGHIAFVAPCQNSRGGSGCTTQDQIPGLLVVTANRS